MTAKWAWLNSFLITFTLGPAAAFGLSLPGLETIAPPLKNSEPSLVQIYNAALKNLDTQFVLSTDGTVYVSTGDIHAEWLRDSSVQTRAYLLFAGTNPEAASLVKGVVLRQARSMAIDPYANAFYEDYTVHERKYELDSLVNPILLAWTDWKTTHDASIFTPEVWAGFKAALATLQVEQDHEQKSNYTHPRLSGNPSVRTGMIWSGFRPSDDACRFNYNIPSNAMAAQGLRALAEIASAVFGDSATAAAAAKLENEVRVAIRKYGVARTIDGETVYAYEVDGLGHAFVIDDANLPSLMSLPYYGFVDAKDPLYLATRARILSAKNPYYFAGTFLRGVGSPHTPKNMVWPLGLISEAITSTAPADFDSVIKTLVASDFGGSGLHESVDVNDASKFTRADFGWPNAMFVEMALTRWNAFNELPRVPAPALEPAQ